MFMGIVVYFTYHEAKEISDAKLTTSGTVQISFMCNVDTYKNCHPQILQSCLFKAPFYFDRIFLHKKYHCTPGPTYYVPSFKDS